MLISLLPPTNPESFTEIGPAIWESIGNKVQDSHPPYVPHGSAVDEQYFLIL